MSVALDMQHAKLMCRDIRSLWPVWLYNILPHYLVKGTVLGGENVIEHRMRVLTFSTNFVWKILFLGRIKWDFNAISYRSSLTVPFILVRVEWNLNFFDRFSEKKSNIKFHENPSSGRPVVPSMRTVGRVDGHYKPNSRF